MYYVCNTKKIKQLIKEQQLTEDKLCKMVGTSQSHLNEIINCKQHPKLSTVKRIANALEIPACELFIKEINKTPRNEREYTRRYVIINHVWWKKLKKIIYKKEIEENRTVTFTEVIENALSNYYKDKG